MAEAIVTQGLTKYYGRRCVVIRSTSACRLDRFMDCSAATVRANRRRLKMLLGFVRPDRGSARLLDEDIGVLAVDQLEELFSRCGDDEERGRFVASLIELAQDRDRRQGRR